MSSTFRRGEFKITTENRLGKLHQKRVIHYTINWDTKKKKKRRGEFKRSCSILKRKGKDKRAFTTSAYVFYKNKLKLKKQKGKVADCEHLQGKKNRSRLQIKRCSKGMVDQLRGR